MPKVIVSKAKIKKDIYETTKRAIKLASKFNVKGKNVLVKPNVNSDDPVPGVANPAVTRAVVDYCFEKGAKSVKVGDRSSVFWPRTTANMKKVGLLDALKGSKAEIIEFKKFRKIDINGKYIKSVRVAQDVLDAEYLINIPVCHTHCLAVFSMALKNMMGAMKRSERLVFHSRNLQKKVAELNLAIKTDLNVLDATYVMYSGGPSEGHRGRIQRSFSGDRCRQGKGEVQEAGTQGSGEVRQQDGKIIELE